MYVQPGEQPWTLDPKPQTLKPSTLNPRSKQDAGVQSDIYNQNDNPINPSSQFSEVGSDSVYKAG